MIRGKCGAVDREKPPDAYDAYPDAYIDTIGEEARRSGVDWKFDVYARARHPISVRIGTLKELPGRFRVGCWLTIVRSGRGGAASDGGATLPSAGAANERIVSCQRNGVDLSCELDLKHHHIQIAELHFATE